MTTKKLALWVGGPTEGTGRRAIESVFKAHGLTLVQWAGRIPSHTEAAFVAHRVCPPAVARTVRDAATAANIPCHLDVPTRSSSLAKWLADNNIGADVPSSNDPAPDARPTAPVLVMKLDPPQPVVPPSSETWGAKDVDELLAQRARLVDAEERERDAIAAMEWAMTLASDREAEAKMARVDVDDARAKVARLARKIGGG